MSTFTVITIAIIALLGLNTVVVLYLRKTKRMRSAPVRDKPIPLLNAIIILTMIGFFTAGLAAPKVAPDSELARLVSDLGYFVYFTWCMIIAVAAQVVIGLVTHFRSSNGRAG
jgi:hypothetical protein